MTSNTEVWRIMKGGDRRLQKKKNAKGMKKGKPTKGC